MLCCVISINTIKWYKFMYRSLYNLISSSLSTSVIMRRIWSIWVAMPIWCTPELLLYISVREHCTHHILGFAAENLCACVSTFFTLYKCFGASLICQDYGSVVCLCRETESAELHTLLKLWQSHKYSDYLRRTVYRQKVVHTTVKTVPRLQVWWRPE